MKRQKVSITQIEKLPVNGGQTEMNTAAASGSSSIETGVMGNTVSDNQIRTSLLPISNISLHDLFENINPKDAESGKLIINNKNKANEHLSRIGIQPSERDKIINLAKDSLPQMTDEVN